MGSVAIRDDILRSLEIFAAARGVRTEAQAEALHISQDGVSRIEKRSDFLLSTLRSYIEAMGGTLRLVAEFQDRKPVTLANLDSLTARTEPAPRRRKAPARTRYILNPSRLCEKFRDGAATNLWLLSSALPYYGLRHCALRA